MPQQDYRARLLPKPGGTRTVLGEKSPSNILFPLHATGGVLFPYTPSLSSGNVADYDATAFIHTNYGYNAYMRSYPKPISLSTEFTAQTNEEALYLLAVMHFFRTVTKSYFGINPYNKAGTPPPTLIFNYMGDYQYNNVPVIIKSFDFKLDANIDYVPISTKDYISTPTDKGVNLPAGSYGGYTWVPTHMTVDIEMDTQYVPIKIRNEFNLDQFREGKLINKGYI